MTRTNKPTAYGFIAGAYFFLFALIVYVTGCAAPLTGALRTGIEKIDSSVAISNVCLGDLGKSNLISAGAGSGVLLGGNMVLTAHHVVSCAGVATYMVTTKDGRFMATLDKDWPDKDVARLLYVSNERFVRRPRIAAVRLGDAVCSSVKVPYENSSCGPVVDRHKRTCVDQEWCHDFTFHGMVRPGNSGGPLYDHDGALVGLVTGGEFAGGIPLGIGLATSLEGVDIYGH